VDVNSTGDMFLGAKIIGFFEDRSMNVNDARTEASVRFISSPKPRVTAPSTNKGTERNNCFQSPRLIAPLI